MTPFDELTETRRTKRTWLRLLIAAVCVGLLAIVGLVFHRLQDAESELQQAIAETDRLDPGWRLEDIENHRATIRDEDNSALQVMALRRLLPGTFGKRLYDDWQYADPPPNMRLAPARFALVKQELARVEAVLKKARNLKDFPRGRYPITYDPNFIATLVTEQQEGRHIAALLQFDVQVLNEDGKPDEALASCRAILNTGRALGDEPLIISQLIRIAECSIALAGIERTLAQGVADEKELAAVQKLLEDEATHPAFLVAMRGERAGVQMAMQALQDGRLSEAQLLSLAGIKPGGRRQSLKEKLSRHLPGEIAKKRAEFLRLSNHLVEAAKMSGPEQLKKLEELEANAKGKPPLVRMLLPPFSTVAGAQQRTRAQIRCAIAGVAAERYRLKQGRWPKELRELKETGYLNAVPTDPVDEKPLRLSRRKNGLVIYSVGEDSLDDNGNINRDNPLAPGTDYGFQLWDVPERRRPYRPPPP
jgi:hypothetical protein